MERDEERRTTGGTEREATDVEREGMDLLGRSGVRDDAIPGVSDASARADQDVETHRDDMGAGGRGDDRTGTAP
jgi:hypothetical protein